MWRAGGNDDTRFPNLEASGAMHDPKMGDLELFMSFSAESLHLS